MWSNPIKPEGIYDRFFNAWKVELPGVLSVLWLFYLTTVYVRYVHWSTVLIKIKYISWSVSDRLVVYIYLVPQGVLTISIISTHANQDVFPVYI